MIVIRCENKLNDTVSMILGGTCNMYNVNRDMLEPQNLSFL